MKKIKSVLTIILAVVLFISVNTFSTPTKAATTGTCGVNALWTFDETTNTLTISGTGAMEDYSNTSVPSYPKKFDNLIIEEGIEYIGTEAFKNSGGVTAQQIVSVSLPSTLKEIGDRGFFYIFLKSIDLPEVLKLSAKKHFAGVV